MSAARESQVSRLRVLVLAPHPYFQERGTPMAVDALVRGLIGRGYDVDLLVYHEGSDREIPGCRLHRIPRIRGVRNIPPGPSWKKLVCDFVMLAEAVRLMRRRRFDLVHSVEEASFIALGLKRLFRIPYVYDMDSSLAQQTVESYGWMGAARPVFEALERHVIRRSLGVVAVNRSLEDLVRTAAPEHLVARLEDFSLLDGTGNGSPTGTYERLHDTIDRDGPLVLYVGNLMPYQGIDLLLDGFRHAAGRHPSAQLVIIGGTADEIPTYRARVANLGLSQRVHFIGPRPSAQLGWFLAQATVLVSPRTVGVNTPMKIYSYLGSGRPVLATRLPTHTQVLDDEIAHLVAPEPVALSDGLFRLLGDEALRRRLGTKARERVAREHSHQAYLRKLNAFFDQVERLLPRRQGRTPPSAAPSPSAVSEI